MIIKNNLDEIQDYLKDASNILGIAEKVLIPENVDELVEIIKESNNNNTKLTFSAGGTGITGSKVPFEGIVVSIERLDKILKIDLDNQIILVQPGVRLKVLQDTLNELGFFFPPNPTENWSTIGGNVATNASGSRSYKYGSYRNFVNYLKVILPNGEVIEIRRGDTFALDSVIIINTNNVKFIVNIPNYQRPNLKNASGYFLERNMDLIDLFIGSEGTLGIFQEIGLNFLKLPESLIAIIVFFDNLDDMFEFLQIQNIKTKEQPSLIEYFDTNSLILLKPFYNQIPNKSKYALWLEFETNLIDAENITNIVLKEVEEHSALSDYTWYAINEKEHNLFAEFRHKLPLQINEIITKNKTIKIGTDTAVPKESFLEYFNYLYEILESSKLDYLIFGHIGDCHLHANILPKNKVEYNEGIKVYKKLIEKAIELGGTISAEHGIGKIKKEAFQKLSNQNLLKFSKQIKLFLDPKLTLNKGNIFDLDDFK
ncbi:MAG: FAD-binding oxidoreductase [Candidatus Kapabacteria bacterium]|nr:FAD-binding oxidoreductase [Candidatus Kapabacteria bacterium]